MPGWGMGGGGKEEDEGRRRGGGRGGCRNWLDNDADEWANDLEQFSGLPKFSKNLCAGDLRGALKRIYWAPRPTTFFSEKKKWFPLLLPLGGTLRSPHPSGGEVGGVLYPLLSPAGEPSAPKRLPPTPSLSHP